MTDEQRTMGQMRELGFPVVTTDLEFRHEDQRWKPLRWTPEGRVIAVRVEGEGDPPTLVRLAGWRWKAEPALEHRDDALELTPLRPLGPMRTKRTWRAAQALRRMRKKGEGDRG